MWDTRLQWPCCRRTGSTMGRPGVTQGVAPLRGQVTSTLLCLPVPSPVAYLMKCHAASGLLCHMWGRSATPECLVWDQGAHVLQLCVQREFLMFALQEAVCLLQECFMNINCTIFS